MEVTILNTACKLQKWLKGSPERHLSFCKVDDGFHKGQFATLTTEKGEEYSNRFHDAYVTGVCFDDGSSIEFPDTVEFLEWVHATIQ